jgi:transcriptional regulator with AAA-type ATPase domain
VKDLIDRVAEVEAALRSSARVVPARSWSPARFTSAVTAPRPVCRDVPALRIRGNDVLLLARQFLEQLSQHTTKKVVGLSPPVAEKRIAYSWPGTVRELQKLAC